MNKKAFTLIELIGTVVILSLIVLIITPAISDNVKKGVEDAKKQTEESIILAAKNYVSDNKSATCVTLQTLQSEGYIDDNLKDPSDSNKILTNKKVTITRTQQENKVKYKYTYEEGNCN